MFKDKTITIFGGTGSIGSLIVDLILPYLPHSIRIFSNDENSLWECEQKWGNDNLRYLLGDVRNYRRVKRAVKDVDYVFNCAAIKHVPIAEYNPMEAVDVNIHGLENIIEACLLYNVEKLLHISTDKAVQPECVMGATKQIGERLCQIRNNNKGKAITKISCIRLGNVWGSRGSFVEIIYNSIRDNKPVPITDINMERYFVKPLGLQAYIVNAFEVMEGGEIFVPKLKKYNLFEIIKEIAGECQIEIIGRRKGEKLKESLITEEELENAREIKDMWVIE